WHACLHGARADRGRQGHAAQRAVLVLCVSAPGALRVLAGQRGHLRGTTLEPLEEAGARRAEAAAGARRGPGPGPRAQGAEARLVGLGRRPLRVHARLARRAPGATAALVAVGGGRHAERWL